MNAWNVRRHWLLLTVGRTGDMESDFPITRSIIARLDNWVQRIAQPLVPARRVPVPRGGFRWQFTEETPRAFVVAKSVRMVSGIRAAMFLADNGFTVEAGTLLRIVSEFAHEIATVSISLTKGELGSAERKLVDQFFRPIATTPEEFEQQDKERYVAREELHKTAYALAEEAGLDRGLLRRVTRYLEYGYDKYVHGGYITAMELYRGDTHEFMMKGVPFPRPRCMAKTSVAGKLHEVVSAFELYALSQGMGELISEVRDARRQIENAPEQTGAECVE